MDWTGRPGRPGRLLWLCLLVAACGGGEELAPQSAAIIGRVEVAADVPATEGIAALSGTPLATKIASDGSFQLKGVPAGTWTLEIRPGGDLAEYPAITKPVGINPSEVRDVGVLTLFAPSFVAGQVLMVASAPETALIGATDGSLITKAAADGTYLLGGIAPGDHDIVAVHNGSSVTRHGINVPPRNVVRNVDFNFAYADVAPAEIFGTAHFMDGQFHGIQVLLLQAANGAVVNSVAVDADGAFRFYAVPNAYVVRAVKDGTSNQVSIPSGVLAAGSAFRVDLLLSAGDGDGDGIADDSDPDIDNDGVPNDEDAFPYDPHEWADSDGDTIGDNSDPDNSRDTDHDGVADGTDNCLFVANAAQDDADADDVGDACDNCPGTPNPDQDATACLSTCENSSDCDGGLLCDVPSGTCVECLNDSDCSDASFCNGSEACDAEHQCQPGPPPSLPDSVACTDDLCNEATDSVDHLPDDSRCDDGLYCDGTESCDANSGCSTTPPPPTSDGIDCTVDACDENSDQITHTPDDSLCPGSGACGIGSCDGNLGCVSTAVALIYDQSGSNTLLQAAVEARGFTATYTSDANAFNTAYNNGGFSVLVIDAPSTLAQSVRDDIVAWASAGNRIIITASSDLYGAPAFGNIFGVTGTSVNTGLAPITNQIPPDLFTMDQSVPSLVISSFEDSRVSFAPSIGSIFAGIYNGGFGAIAISNNNLSIVNGFSTRELLTEAVDGDFDSVNDGQELLENELQYVCTGTQESSQTIATGTAHTCAITTAGKVRCWGQGTSGQLGYGNIGGIGDDEPARNGGDVNVGGTATRIAAGASHTCALLDTGAVRCWGSGGSGRLGYGNTSDIGDDESPASAGNVNVGGTVTQIAVGGAHSCALLATGAVRCWGLAASGRLGYGNANNIGDNESPASAGDVPLGGVAVQISAGGAHTCALMASGNVRCWGLNNHGQLGYGNIQDVGDNETPASIGDVPLGIAALAISAGGSHTCVVTNAGGIMCWGENTYGELGYASTTTIGDNETPASMGPITLGSTAVAVTAGAYHTCARTSNGAVRCWGYNSDGELGLGHTNHIGDNEGPANGGEVPFGGTANQVAAGGFHTCVRIDDDSIRCWGGANWGQLGYGNVTQIGDNEFPSAAGDVPWLDSSNPALHETVAAGGHHTCAITPLGAARCWGDGSGGELGYGNTNVIGDNETANSGGDISLPEAISQIATGDTHTCALSDQGYVRCWGNGNFGKLGYGNINSLGDDESLSALFNVSLGNLAIQVVTGVNHTCALLQDGTVRCWGYGQGGQLGYGNTNDIGDNEVPSSLGPVPLGTTAIQLAAGDNHTCAVLTGGAVRCWGLNAQGQLGYANINTIGDNETPQSVGVVNVGGLVTQIVAGGTHTCALLNSGDVHCWGNGSSGQLGYGNISTIGDDETPSSAGNVPIGGAVAQLAAGSLHTCALLVNGGVRCWGSGTLGELGYGNTNNIGDNETPASVGNVNVMSPSLVTISEITAGAMHTCARLSNSTIRCWGAGAQGRLGYGNVNDIGDNETPASAGDISWYP